MQIGRFLRYNKKKSFLKPFNSRLNFQQTKNVKRGKRGETAYTSKHNQLIKQVHECQVKKSGDNTKFENVERNTGPRTMQCKSSVDEGL